MARSGKSRKGGGVRVNAYSEGWLRKRFPWVYPGEVQGGLPARAGTEVTVIGPKGDTLARGLSDTGWLAVRVFRHDDGPLDAAWLDGVLDRADALRARVVPAQTTGWRMIHGENDGLPGIRLDWWDGWATLVLDSPALAPLVPLLVERLQARRTVHGVFLCYRPDPRDDLDLSGVSPAPGWVLGERPADEVSILERGLTMLVRPWEGPDVGSYLDMREVRRWMEPSWAGRSVLNTFAYTCAFSVAAAKGGAERVVSVDLSGKYLDRGRANFVANGLDPAEASFEVDDTFKAMDRYRRKGQLFDVVVLDPPSHSHGPGGVWSAKRHMPRLVSSAARITAPAGWLVVASNQGQVSPREFRGQVADGLKKADRAAAEIAWFGAAPDFPAAVTFPEGRYLKVGVWHLA